MNLVTPVIEMLVSRPRAWLRSALFLSTLCLLAGQALAQHDIALRGVNGQWVTHDYNGGSAIFVRAPQVFAWEEARVIDLNGGDLYPGDRVAVQANSGHYYRAEGGGGLVVNATSPWIGAWETFVLVRVGGSGPVRSGDRIGFRTMTGHYFTARIDWPDRRLAANVPWFSDWEVFRYFISQKGAINFARQRLGGNGGFGTYECLKFVRVAYGYRSSFANVHVAIDRARSLGLLETSPASTAPRGAWVMYRWSTVGHIGIKTDGDKLIHLLTSNGAAKVVETPTNLSGMTYAGFVRYENIPQLMGL